MREFSIDMIPGGTQTAVACNQFEAGDTWIFALYYDGGRYSIPADAEVSITGTKPDGAAYKVAGTVTDNAVVIEVTEQMTACAGRSIAEILVESETDGTTLYSANFPLLVEPAAVQADLSPSEIPTAIVGPDGTVYYSEEAVISEGVTSEVRQALYTLLNSAAYAQTGLTDEIAVIQSWAQQITAISVSPTTASISGTGTSQLSATTTPAGGTVTWSSSDTSVATVSSSGLVTGVGNGTATITASAGGKSATCAVTVTGNATLESISATYTQSGTVYDTDSLDDLKDDLVVTGTYDDSSTAVITDYTLSGTLAEGTSTITVSYGGFTDTFSVTVTAAEETALYSFYETTYSASSASYETSDGNHFAVETTANGRSFFVDEDSCGTVIQTGTMFSIGSGASYEFNIKNIVFASNSSSSNYFAVALKDSSGNTIITSGNIEYSSTAAGTLSDVTVTGTLDSAADIASVLVYTYRASVYEFDVTLYINGTRYI